jgi:glycosyltransferase involved in cell wall biosynthesis
VKVSIIIPVFNSEKFLRESICSAINQTYDDIEIIVINDGSTDNSIDILNQFSEKIKIINKINGGAASAINVGIKSSSGNWIKFHAPDDILKNNAIEILVKKVNELKDPEHTILYSNYEIIDSHNNKIHEYVEPDFNKLTQFEKNVILLDHSILHPLTSLIPINCFNECGLMNENLKYVEDYEFWLRCCILHNYKLIHVPQITAEYRIHQDQLTQTKNKEMSHNSKVIRNSILDKLSPDLRFKYKKKLELYQKTMYPKHIQILRSIRRLTMYLLPNSISKKIIDKSMKSKKINKIYQNVRLSWEEFPSESKNN